MMAVAVLERALDRLVRALEDPSNAERVRALETLLEADVEYTQACDRVARAVALLRNAREQESGLEWQRIITQVLRPAGHQLRETSERWIATRREVEVRAALDGAE